MAQAPSTPDSTTRRTVLGLARDTCLSAETIARARRSGYGVYDATGGGLGGADPSAVFDCTVYTYGLAANGGDGGLSVWDR
jgi:hypothetical protein